MSRHNKAKHWVDDVNNRRHDPIGLEEVWATKWWPNRQFTFLMLVTEVNAIQSRARARKLPAESQMEFRRKLAMKMLENKVNETGESPMSPMRRRKRALDEVEDPHQCMTRPLNTGKWDFKQNRWSQTKSLYSKMACIECGQLCRTYCACNKSKTMCLPCWGDHKKAVGRTFS